LAVASVRRRSWLYLGAGLFGIPWFSRGGGLNYILSPTFGYLIGFVAAAYVVGKIMELNRGKNLLNAISAILAGEFLIYFFGVLWLAKFVTWQNVLAVGVYPFIIGDLLKIALVGTILPLAYRFKKYV